MHSHARPNLFGTTLARLAGVAWLLAGATVAAGAQAPQSEPPPDQPASRQSVAPTSQVPDQEMETFVKTVQQVNEVRKDLKDKAGAAQDPTAAKQAQDEANAKMAGIIQACGMKVDRYNELARAVSSDPQVSQQFQATQKQLADRHDLTCGSNGSAK